MGKEISNIEWGLYIGAILMAELVQFILTILLIGAFINPIIATGVGMARLLYLKLRGANLDKKKIGGMVASYLFELVPGLNALPFLTLNAILDMVLYKADRKVHQVAASASRGNRQPANTSKRAV
jgi:hypothetical protein